MKTEISIIYKDKDIKSIIDEMMEKIDKPTLETMKEDLDICNQIAKILSEKITEEEKKRFKQENHLIEKKVRMITKEDKMVYRSKLKSFKSVPKKILEEEIYTYERKGNKVICKIKTSVGTFIGEAIQHPEDDFNYESGMMLARVRAKKKMYEDTEKLLISVL